MDEGLRVDVFLTCPVRLITLFTPHLDVRTSV